MHEKSQAAMKFLMTSTFFVASLKKRCRKSTLVGNKFQRAKKSQAAMEFLMTYGWALLVVIIAIGALAYFGILNPNQFLPDKVNLEPGLNVQAFTIDESKIELYIKNNLGKDIRNFQINATICNEISEPINIAKGKLQNITIECSEQVTNEKFKTDLIFNYSTKILSESLTHKKKVI